MPKGVIPLVFVITDGIEAVTTSVHRGVGALPPGSVHMLLVDRASGCTEEMEADWRGVAFGSFTRLDDADTRAMGDQLAATVAAAIGANYQPEAAD